MKCVHCGSTRIIPEATIMDRDRNFGNDLTACVVAKPSALIFKQTHYSPLFGRICGDCGYVELFAENPRELYEAYLQSQRS